MIEPSNIHAAVHAFMFFLDQLPIIVDAVHNHYQRFTATNNCSWTSGLWLAFWSILFNFNFFCRSIGDSSTGSLDRSRSFTSMEIFGRLPIWKKTLGVKKASRFASPFGAKFRASITLIRFNLSFLLTQRGFEGKYVERSINWSGSSQWLTQI